MITRRNQVFVWVSLLIAALQLSTAILSVRVNNGPPDTLLMGYCIGALFANTTLAAAWTTFGPASLLWRLPLSVCWICSLGLVMAVEILINNGPREIPVLFVACFLGLWLVLQLPLWSLKIGLRAHLRLSDDPQMPDALQWQFGIRQLLIITTMVAIAFAIGRAVLGTNPFDSDFLANGLTVFLFLAASAVAFSLLVLLASLLERPLLGLSLVTLVITLGTIAEAPLMLRMNGAAARPNLLDLIAVNGFTCGIVFLVALIVRLCGYSLTRSQVGTSVT